MLRAHAFPKSWRWEDVVFSLTIYLDCFIPKLTRALRLGKFSPKQISILVLFGYSTLHKARENSASGCDPTPLHGIGKHTSLML